MKVVLNGGIVPVDHAKIGLTQPGVLYGEGCFETLRLHAGQPRFFTEHWTRFHKGAEALGLPMPYSETDLRDQVIGIARANRITDGVARLSLHQTFKGADLLIFATPPRRELPPSFRIGISHWPHPGHSPNGGIKHNNYALFRAAHAQARKDGWDECLLCNVGQIVVEGAISNLFWVDSDGQLATPPLSTGALPGVIRERVMALFPAIIERAPAVEELARAQEIFLTNSTFEIMPVSELNSHAVFTSPGKQTSLVAQTFRDTYPLPQTPSNNSKT